MLRKVFIALILFLLFNPTSSAQSLQISLSYHSFEPFIHFQLRFDNHRYPHSYRMAYLKGYMDGVNDHYRYAHRYRAMVRAERAYELGYHDGFRDRGLLMQICGRNWLRRHHFSYRDYYSPSYSVRIWLDNMTLAFLKAPARRLPPGWQRKVHPRVRRYRGWMKWRHNRRGYDDFDDYYEEYDNDDYEEYYEEYEEDEDDYEYFGNLQRRYQKRIKHFSRQARKIQRNTLKRISHRPNRNRGNKRYAPDALKRGNSRKAYKRKKHKRGKRNKRGRGHGRENR